jgi:hypothetical protein
MFFIADTENSLNQSLHYLLQLQMELRKMLRECAIGESVSPRHSLFSSRRIFRTDELSLGLRRFQDAVFSLN